MIRYLQGLLTIPEDAQTDAASLENLRAAFRNLPVLESERLLLRAPRIHDAEDMYAYARDAENCRYVMWEAHANVWESRDALRSIIHRNRRGGPGTFAIELRSEGRMIGTIGFQWIDTLHGSGEVGYSIARRLWNHGLATEALRTLLPFAFDTLGLRRVEARHDMLNPASGQVMSHAGFRPEGIARGSVRVKGRMADMACYAILREDWQALMGVEGNPGIGGQKEGGR